jgi:hypothetical protein
MNIKGWLKAIFPKPVWPQKRYIVAIALLGYALGKAYTYYTPNPYDDEIPDRLKDAVMLIVHNELDKGDDDFNTGQE